MGDKSAEADVGGSEQQKDNRRQYKTRGVLVGWFIPGYASSRSLFVTPLGRRRLQVKYLGNLVVNCLR